jgi:hypothetical protein
MLQKLTTKQLIHLYKMRMWRKECIYDKYIMYRYGTEPFWFLTKKLRTLERQVSLIVIALEKRGYYVREIVK